MIFSHEVSQIETRIQEKIKIKFFICFASKSVIIRVKSFPSTYEEKFGIRHNSD